MPSKYALKIAYLLLGTELPLPTGSIGLFFDSHNFLRIYISVSFVLSYQVFDGRSERTFGIVKQVFFRCFFSIPSWMGESNQDFCDQEQKSPSSNSFGCVSCTTFNILAPIYKRLNDQVCLTIVLINTFGRSCL